MTYPRLIADIGGTNARFALEKAPYQLSEIEVLPCADYDTLHLATQAYLNKHQLALPCHLGFAIANPVTGDTIRMTNHHWQFSISQMKSDLGVETLLFVNDFTAQALAITQMSSDDLRLLNGPSREHPTPSQLACAVIGPGTGLGVSGLIPDGRGGMVALAGEGGHASFAPADDRERALQDHILTQIGGGHVSVERLLQGQGLTLINQFLGKKCDVPIKAETPADVTRLALVEKDPLCVETLNQYCAILGGACANVALTLGAFGGVYLTGGIIPRMTDFVRQSPFRERFEAKGRFQDYLNNIPVYVVNHDYPGLLGAAVALQNHLH